MRRLILLFPLLFLISGCGDKAPDDAVVTGPTNTTTTVSSSGPLIYRALDFKVANSAGDPLPELEIQFFAGGGGTLVNVDGVLLGTGSIYNTFTDERGIARVSFGISIADCGGSTTDLVTVGGVRGTVGNADYLWTTTVTLTCP